MISSSHISYVLVFLEDHAAHRDGVNAILKKKNTAFVWDIRWILMQMFLSFELRNLIWEMSIPA